VGLENKKIVAFHMNDNKRSRIIIGFFAWSVPMHSYVVFVYSVATL